MKKIKLNIAGMHCPSCEMLITDSLEDLDGIEIIQISHKKGYAIISYDESKTNEDKIKKIIEKEGYKVE